MSSYQTEWIETVIHHPLKEVIQNDGRIRRWGLIPEAGGKYLRGVSIVSRWVNGSQCLLRPEIYAMRIQYFRDTGTLYIAFRPADIAETRDLDENTLLDIDTQGQICGITIEHASDRADIPQFSFEQVAA